MALNETSAKLDLQLDSICKKIERIALDTGRGKLMFNNRDQESKLFLLQIFARSARHYKLASIICVLTLAYFSYS